MPLDIKKRIKMIDLLVDIILWVIAIVLLIAAIGGEKFARRLKDFADKL